MRLFLLTTTLLLQVTLAHAGEWKQVSEYGDGLVLDKRKVKESSYEALRVTTRSKLSPKTLADSTWRIRNEGWEFRIHKKRVVLSETATERVLYQQVLTPIISDRDYTVRQRRLFDPMTGVHQMLFDAANEVGPPPNDEHVRIALIHGSWTFEPDGDGGTVITYVMLNDPAGSLPAWIARGALRDSALSVVREALIFADRDRTVATGAP